MESAQQTPELTIPAALDQAAARFGSRDALYADGSWLTFSELRTRARRFAAALIALGVEHGDRVAIWSPNSWHWPIACLGAQYAGAAVVPMNTRYTVDEATDILQRSQARVLVSVGVFLGSDRITQLDAATLPDLRHIVRVAVEAGDRSDWDEFVAHGNSTLR